MTGGDDVIQMVRWADARLEALTFAYDAVELVLVESNGCRMKVITVGPFGVKIEGFWDETVIEDADIVAAHPFAEQCWDSIVDRSRGNPSDSGSDDRNRRSFLTLVVTLIDRCRIVVAA